MATSGEGADFAAAQSKKWRQFCSISFGGGRRDENAVFTRRV